MFQHNCGLRHRHGPAWRQHLLIAAGRNADILLAEQASGQNFCCTVARKLITLINIEPHPGLITGVVELNARDAPDAHPRAFDRRAGFKAADIVECEFERISARERPAQQRRQPSSPVSFFSFHCPNMSAVNTKSSPNTASDENTTVRVVARATPSGVGFASYPWNKAIKATVKPNAILLTTPLPISRHTSTPPCICDQNAPASTPINRTPTR